MDNQIVNLLRRVLREQIAKQVDQVASDIAAEEFVLDIIATRSSEHVLNRSADIARGVHQSAVYVEEIDGEVWNRQS
jgi:hypothetical protein